MRRALIVAAALIIATGCKREERRFHDPAGRPNRERLVSLVPGPYTQDVRARNPYEYNAHAISEGKRLFTWYNCTGCHANGGGGMGPPLMDERWIYGEDAENIYATILEGRPNGMPSFRGKIPEYQVWQLVAYVQSLSGNVPKDAAGGRPDSMQAKKQEQSVPDLKPEREPARRP
jgi:cytochrome c oxidase cbb3-type subunit III